MTIIQIPNKWVEKKKKKKGPETAPAYEFNSIDTWAPAKVDKNAKRHSFAARATYKKTLRDMRK